MRHTHVCFDLDGTLLDTGPGVKHAYQHALRALGRPAPPVEELDFVMGPPLLWSFCEASGLSAQQAQQALALFRAQYESGGLWECSVFGGVADMLRALRAAGAHLAVVTGKPQSPAVRLLRHFGLAELFEAVVGAKHEAKEAEKRALLAQALAQMAPWSADSAVMVGDRRYDIEGAHALGVRAVGVTYGFGSAGELTAAGADDLADSPAALTKLLLR